MLLTNAGFNYINILKEGRKNNRISILIGVFKRSYRLYKLLKKEKVDMLIGTSVENPIIGSLLKIPAVNLNEDDADVVPLYAKLSYPFSSTILTPVSCDNGRWNKKSIKYESYHELAYLHPNNFNPKKNIVDSYIKEKRPYFLIRFADLGAHHDSGIAGINTKIAQNIIDILRPYGYIYITSERPLEKELENLRININPIDIHHVLAFAKLFIGDSQTMAAEAAVLGTPFIRINDFAGRIGYLRELEERYHLGYSSSPENKEYIIMQLQKLLELPNLEEIFNNRKDKMLVEKLDFTQYLTNFIENY